MCNGGYFSTVGIKLHIKSTLWKEEFILACVSKGRLIMVGQLKQDTEQSHLNHMQKTQRENGSEVGKHILKTHPQ